MDGTTSAHASARQDAAAGRMPLGLRKDLLRYLGVGLINTVVGLGTIYTCIYEFHLPDVQANLIGYAVGIACSFTLNRKWTFASTGHWAAELVRFLIVLGIAYLANLGAVMALIDLAGVNRYVAQALGVVPYTACGYLGSRDFAFRSRPRGAL